MQATGTEQIGHIIKMGHLHHFGAQSGLREFIKRRHHRFGNTRITILKIPVADADAKITQFGLKQPIPEHDCVLVNTRIDCAEPDHQIIDASGQRTSGV